MSTNYPPGVSGNEPEIIGADDGESWAGSVTLRFEQGAPAPRQPIDGQLSLIGPNDARVDGEQLTLW